MLNRFFIIIIVSITFMGSARGELVSLSFSNTDFQLTNVFSNVDLFVVEIQLEIPLQPGLYDNPELISVDYRVFGSLAAGTPSGFPSFDLQRSMDGVEFYQQGSSLVFQIADTADFSDGIQANELVDIGYILTLNAREIDNRRFHPAILELYADGTGRIQNSNNIHTEEPLLAVNFGDEYITDLAFEPSELTLIREIIVEQNQSSSGGGSLGICLLMLLAITRRQHWFFISVMYAQALLKRF
jgi:hypothetical protein